jgi:hypothetical protein
MAVLAIGAGTARRGVSKLAIAAGEPKEKVNAQWASV